VTGSWRRTPSGVRHLLVSSRLLAAAPRRRPTRASPTSPAATAK
jgi:hypothetical protein